MKPTPTLTSSTLNRLVSANIYFKCENLQKIGAFKFRGACNALLQLSESEKSKGVITHSSGNHAQAIAAADQKFGIKTTIIMPKNASKVKIEATRETYGAKVYFCENTVAAREQTTKDVIEKEGGVLIHAYNDIRIIHGAGTCFYEMYQEHGEFDYVFCPVGGGGFLSGTAIAAKGSCGDKCKVIAVEPELAKDAFLSLQNNKIHEPLPPVTIADGLRTNLGELTFQMISKYVDLVVTVTEEEILAAMKLIWERMKIIVEPSGVVSFAGAIKMKDEIKGKKIAVLLSGGNVNLEPIFQFYENQIKAGKSVSKL